MLNSPLYALAVNLFNRGGGRRYNFNKLKSLWGSERVKIIRLTYSSKEEGLHDSSHTIYVVHGKGAMASKS